MAANLWYDGRYSNSVAVEIGESGLVRPNKRQGLIYPEVIGYFAWQELMAWWRWQ